MSLVLLFTLSGDDIDWAVEQREEFNLRIAHRRVQNPHVQVCVAVSAL